MFSNVLVLLAGLTAAQDPDKFGLLKNSRDLFDFVPYTPEQRVQVAQTMSNLFSIYANRYSKIENYSKDFPDIDPIPRMKKILDNAASMTDKDFHYDISALFLSLRDGHTNYYMPGPHACNYAFRAPRFTVAEEVDWMGKATQKIVLHRFIRYDQVLSLTPDAAKMNIGDELISIDGKPIHDYITDYLFKHGGANEYGGLRGVLYSLSVQVGLFDAVPPKDEVVYMMKSFTTGKMYKVTIPWVVGTLSECEKVSRGVMDTIKKGKEPTISSFTENSNVGPNKMDGLIFVDKRIVIDNAAYGNTENFAKVNVNPTDDPIIKWAIYKPETKNMGVIFMDSFMPAGYDSTGVVKLIRSLLLNELKETDSLLFDIRNNGGGIITMADIIPQLFKSGIVPGGARALVSDINRDLFLNSTTGAGQDWAEAYLKTKRRDVFTKVVTFTSEEEANELGNAYTKPVGVFNNGNCYSSCDLFSANMQDNKVATIFGEDGKSGAGGANVVEWKNYLGKLRPDHFPPPPYEEVLGPFSQNARIGWRQSVRAGANNGKLIEDIGVKSDKIIRPIPADLIPKQESNTQYDRIADALNLEALETGKKYRVMQVQPQNDVDTILGEGVTFDIDMQGFKKVLIVDEDNRKVFDLNVPNTQIKTRETQHIQFQGDMLTPQKIHYTIKAYNELGKQVFITSRGVRTLPSPTNYLQIGRKRQVTIGLAKLPKYGAQYDDKSIKGLGWNGVKGGGLRIGDGVQYQNNINSKISYFVNVKSTSVKLNVKATFDTEFGFDYLYIGYVINGTTVQLLKSTNLRLKEVDGVSGKDTIDATFKIVENGAIEFFVHFVSDSGVTGVGATIESLTLTAA